MADLFPNAKLHFDNATGSPLVGGKLYTYAAGTNTNKTTWQDSAGTVTNTNPIILDARGECTAYGSGVYKFVLKDSLDNTVWTQDNVSVSGYAALSAALAASTGTDNIGFIQTGTGAVARTVTSKLRDAFSVLDFGADPTGVADSRAAIQAAATAAIGSKLVFPAGKYLINTDGGTITLENVTIEGNAVQDGITPFGDVGSTFFITGTTNSPFMCKRGVEIRGMGFYYPNQINSLTPTVYPDMITFIDPNPVQFFRFVDNIVYNAYNAITLPGSGNIGPTYIERNSIYAINRAILVPANHEALYIRHNHITFGFFLDFTEAGTKKYTRTSGIALQVLSTDGLFFQQNLIYGYNKGIYFNSGLARGVTIQNNYFDSTNYPIIEDSTAQFDRGAIQNNTFVAVNDKDATTTGVAILLNGSGGTAKHLIANNLFPLSLNQAISVTRTPACDITVTGCIFELWSYQTGAAESGAISINGANHTLTATACTFLGTSSAVRDGISITSGKSMQVTGCRFVACKLPITTASLTYAILTSNYSESTTGTNSDNLSGATSIIQTNNQWDKPSGNSTEAAFSVRKATPQTFNSVTDTNLTFDTEVYDRGSNFASPTFTAPVPARYRFEWMVTHDNTATAGDRWQIKLNLGGGGKNFAQTYTAVANYNSISGACEMELAAGGTATLQIARLSGAGTLTTWTDASMTTFSGSLVR